METPAAERLYPENKYGELGRADTTQPMAPESTSTEGHDGDSYGQDTKWKTNLYHSDQVYPENKFGELGHADSSNQSDDHVNPFEDTQTPSQVSLEDPAVKIYVEDQWGEMRTPQVEEPDCFDRLGDKLKGTTEQVVGKLIGNHALHDKGVQRKSRSASPLPKDDSSWPDRDRKMRTPSPF